MDDKELIIDVQLEESKAYYHLSNLTKARAALTSARTVANSKYVPPKTQVSGILAPTTVKFINLRLHAIRNSSRSILHADEKDFKTAFSYFYESFESYDSVNETTEAMRALKYMLLCKVSILLRNFTLTLVKR